MRKSKKRDRNKLSPESIEKDRKKAKEMLQDNTRLADVTWGELISVIATKKDIESWNNKITENETKIFKLESKNLALEAKLTDLEDRSRRNNLVFKGLETKTGTDSKTLILNFLKEKMEIDDIPINRAHQLGKVAGIHIAHILLDSDINKILGNGIMLKGTNYSISRDYSGITRGKRNFWFALKKEINKIVPNLDMKITVSDAIIKKERFTLTSDLKIVFEKNDGLGKLGLLLNTDISLIYENLRESWTKDKVNS